MSVRKRSWKTTGGAQKEAWIVDFADIAKRRRLKTFATKKDADRFAGVVKAVGSGAIPEPLTKGYRAIEFVAPIPFGGWRKGSGREVVAEAARAQCPALRPTTGAVVVHIIAEMPPSSVVADVDNLLKPAIDALKGVAWIDDTQVCELLVRRIPGRQRRLHVKIWRMPGPELAAHLNAFVEAGLYGHYKRGIIPAQANSDLSAAASSSESSPRANKCP
jgi:hypothetical protein